MILDTWLKSYRDSAFARSAINADEHYRIDDWKLLEKARYFVKHEKVARRLLKQATTLIASPAEDTDIILGYVVYEPGLVHYCYVKPEARGMGIANLLTAHLDVSNSRYSHWSRDCDCIEKLNRYNYDVYSII